MNFQKDINECLRVLERGGIILYPTDTVWGLGCDATNEQAVEKLYRLKERPQGKSMIILLADANEIKNYAPLPPPEITADIVASLRPVTVIYPRAKNLAKNLIAEDGSIAIRIVKDTFCSVLLSTFGKPIVSTSANISAEPTPGYFNTIATQIKDRTDYIVRHRQNDESPSAPSRILKWTEAEGLVIIRND